MPVSRACMGLCSWLQEGLDQAGVAKRWHVLRGEWLQCIPGMLTGALPTRRPSRVLWWTSTWSRRSQGRRGYKGGFKEFQSLRWWRSLLQSTRLQGVEGWEETTRSGVGTHREFQMLARVGVQEEREAEGWRERSQRVCFRREKCLVWLVGGWANLA